jgi:hypothetical protein
MAYIVMKYRNGKTPHQENSDNGPTFSELEPALETALRLSKADASALVLVETTQGDIAAAFIWGDRVVPHLYKTS